MRAWKTHDLVDLFESTRRGFLPLPFKKFSNYSHNDTPNIDIVQHDVNYPQHMEFIIEDNIPVPGMHRGSASLRQIIATMAGLKPGQSFMLPEPSGSATVIGSLRARITTKAKKEISGAVFVTRTVRDDGKILGLRIWRVEEPEKTLNKPPAHVVLPP